MFSDPSDLLSLIVKNYERGLSKAFFSTENEVKYKVSGPFGIGILPDNCMSGGTFVAFAAGTGVLCFMDLVALMARVAIAKYRENKG